MASICAATPLTEAAKSANKAEIERLLKSRVDVNQPDEDGTTALHWAVRNNDALTVTALLKAGAKAATANRLGVTPLSLAATNRNPAIAEQLLNAGADPNAATEGGQTVLMTAARAGDAAVVDLLLARGAKIDAAGAQFGETALIVAASENQPDAVRALIKRGAPVNGRSRAMTYDKDRFGLEGVVTILPKGSWTPLMYAARQGAVEAVRALAEQGADLNLIDPEGTTALLLAISNGHFDTAALLIEKGANVTTADSAGMTPLYAAVDMNTLGEIFGRPLRPPTGKLDGIALMKILLDKGANPNAQLKGPAIQRAHTPGEPSLGEGATALMRAAKNGDAAAIDLLIEHGANVNLAAKNGTAPLMFAAGLGRGVSAFAADYGTESDLLAVAKLLVAAGADVNATSAAGNAAIHYAAGATDANFAPPTDMMLRYLLDQSAKVNVTDKQGRTPVDFAMGKGLRGRAGGPVKPREETAALLRKLLEAK